MGDFNAHHEAWNCEKTDGEGIKLCDATEKFNLFLYNTDTLTHIDEKTGNKSNIDLIFSNSTLAPYMRTEVLDDLMGFDHFPVRIVVDTE